MKRYIQTISLLFFINISYGQELPSWSKGISHSNYVGKTDFSYTENTDSYKVLTEFKINESGDLDYPIIGKYMYQVNPESPYLTGELMNIQIIGDQFDQLKAKWFEKTFVGSNEPIQESWGNFILESNDGWKTFSGYFTDEHDEKVGRWTGDRIYIQDGPNGFKPPEKNTTDENILILFFDEFAEKVKNKELATLLNDVYFNYITIKNCYEGRKTKLVPYVDLATYEKYRSHTKLMENYVLDENKNIDSDGIWDKASEIWNNSLVGMLVGTGGSEWNKETEGGCDMAKLYFILLETEYKNILQKKTKKDF
ncbi:MAG: hypothetical protein QF814_02550 [Candidatus Marinimicrobia bacterium]|jgi:hypothetical protein|nr:hypothetical protein [Candidatus Neomarinimicrobiota bacterium]|tara:strand:- start:3552 stop:4481 length:930 start_codon:yes stop_codon:yes gene_type:complete